MDFKFELNTGDNNLYGTIDLGATDGVSPAYRITIRSNNSRSDVRGGVFQVFIEQYVYLPGTDYWTKLKYKNISDINKDFSIQLNGQIILNNFDWITFYFTNEVDGLYLKKVSKPNTIDAYGIGNLNLDRIVSQEGYVLNKFQMRVIETLVKKDKEKNKHKGL